MRKSRFSAEQIGTRLPQVESGARIKEIAATRVHYGYRRVHVLLRCEGWKDNCKRVYRLYRAEGLSLRYKRPRRNKSARLRQPKSAATALNEVWSMDFVSDALYDGRRLRALTVVYNFTRECLAIAVGANLKGDDVATVLNEMVARRGRPCTIKSDNGSEFISKVMDQWAYDHQVELDFSRPGKPTDNAKSESFNGRFREECLNATGSCRSTTRSGRSRRGGSTITRRAPTHRWSGRRPLNSPAGRGFQSNPMGSRSRLFPPLAGTDSGSASNPDSANCPLALLRVRGAPQNA